MSGLVSKWATDEQLSKQALVQDSNVKKNGSRETSLSPSKSENSGSVIISKTQQLESKWASDEPSTSPRATKEFNKGQKDGRKEPEANSLPSPPSTAGQAHSREKPHNGRKSTNKEKHNNRDKCANKDIGKDKAFDKSTNRRRRGSRDDKTRIFGTPNENHSRKAYNDDNATPGSAPSRSTRSKKNEQRGNRPSVTEFLTSSEEKKSGHSQDDGSSKKSTRSSSQSDEEERPPLSEAGMSLAARLGMFSVDDNTPAKTPPKPKNPNTKYKTPMQQKREKLKLMQEEEDKRKREEDALKEERLKAEVNDMFEKLKDSSQSWADLDD